MKRIFLIEDDQAIAKNLMLLLQSEGFIVTHAATRKEATDTLADNKFDLALIDISLPDGNGLYRGQRSSGHSCDFSDSLR